MFNPDAEVFVIFYPHGTGGRFLQSVLCLDPSIMSVALSQSGPHGNKNLFARLTDYLSSSTDAHIDNTGHLPEYIPEKMRRADRYIFCVHQNEYGSAIAFLQTCKNLKLIMINMTSAESRQLVDDRRIFLGRKILDNYHRSTYRVKENEPEFVDEFNELVSYTLDVAISLIIDVDQYWNPETAIPILNNYFNKHNINCNNWEELYYIWLDNSINVCKKSQ